MALSVGLRLNERRGGGTAFGFGEIGSSGERCHVEIASAGCVGAVGVAAPHPVGGVDLDRVVGWRNCALRSRACCCRERLSSGRVVVTSCRPRSVSLLIEKEVLH